MLDQLAKGLEIVSDLRSSESPRSSSSAISTINTASQFYKNAAELWNATKSRIGYSVAVTSYDSLYIPLQRWLIQNIPHDRQRAVVAESNWGRAGPLMLSHDGDREHFVKVDGYRVSVTFRAPDAAKTTRGATIDYAFEAKAPNRIIITSFSKAARDAVVGLLGKLADELVNRTDASPSPRPSTRRPHAARTART